MTSAYESMMAEMDTMQRKITALEGTNKLLNRQLTECHDERDIFKRTLDKRDIESAAERMSAEKTYDHNNRLINENDRLRAALERIAGENSLGCSIAGDGHDACEVMYNTAREALSGTK